MSDSSDNEEALLFGDADDREMTAIVVPQRTPEEIEVAVVAGPDRLPVLNADSRIVKLPASALSVRYGDGSGENRKSANLIQCRTNEDGSLESNARLIEWEDGSWLLVVGSEHFRVIERSEDVCLFDKQPSGYSVSVGSVSKQFNVIPASLDSRTHRHVVEQSAVARKLTETRKVALAHGLAGSTGGGTVNTISVQPSSQPRGQKLTAAFLEAGLEGSRSRQRSVREIKASYKKQRKIEEDEERQSDVDFIDDESLSGSDSGSSDSSDSSSDSSSSSASSSSSSSN
jgi:hypothetical protein